MESPIKHLNTNKPLGSKTKRIRALSVVIENY